MSLSGQGGFTKDTYQAGKRRRASRPVGLPKIVPAPVRKKTKKPKGAR